MAGRIIESSISSGSCLFSALSHCLEFPLAQKKEPGFQCGDASQQGSVETKSTRVATSSRVFPDIFFPNDIASSFVTPFIENLYEQGRLSDTPDPLYLR